MSLNKIWNICKTILKILVLLIAIFLFFKVVVFDDDDDEKNKFILENTEIIGYFNQTNTTYTAFWSEGSILYTISKNSENILKISKGEECNEDIVNSEGKCIKMWSNLNENDVVIVAIAKKEKVLNETLNFEDE